MSGVLHRLAGQALGAQAKGVQRIRPAASVHAQVPNANPSEPEEVRSTLRLPPQQFAADVPVIHEVSTVPHAAARDPAYGVPESLVREQARKRLAAGTADAATRVNLAPIHERVVEDLPGRTPKPLLDEVQTPTVPPAIAPVITALPAVIATSQNSSAEPTEVHVHIGRIEVIAAREPASPKKNRATSTRKTLPLADYLAQRRHS